MTTEEFLELNGWKKVPDTQYLWEKGCKVFGIDAAYNFELWDQKRKAKQPQVIRP